jgi:hypothetical protein
MAETVTYRYSDVDFVAYLLVNGYKYDRIEVTRDRNKNLKGYVHFTGDKEILLSYFNQYQEGKATANVLELKSNRKKISKLIKSEILKYQASNL